MARSFNTAGPCVPELHYMLPPLRRLPEVRALVDGRHYFVIHAPRQTGKTTAVQTLADDLTRAGTYCAARLSVENARVFERIEDAEPAILDAWTDAALAHLPADLQPPAWPPAVPGARVGRALLTWSRASQRPLALFLDEFDSLQPAVLASLLSQLRNGFSARPRGFPWSLALVGMRDVRDYVLASGGSGRRGSGSPFNVSSGSLALRNFDHAEVAELCGQHTAETGQPFTAAAVERAYELTQGQPWLVNALARECVERLVTDRSLPVEVEQVDQAKERLILRLDTHLDSLVEILREPRVRGVIEPILAGGVLADVTSDDIRYVVELGLARPDPETGSLAIANPVYREVIPRALASAAALSFPPFRPTWLTADGRLDEERLLSAVVSFWRQHGEPLMRAAPYHEIAPHLVFMAFLHRVANGGGVLEREFAIGSGRVDLCLRYGDVTLPIELKVWRPDGPDPRAEGLAQLDGYLAGVGADHGWLVIFDRRPGRPPQPERTSAEHVRTPAGRDAVVIRA